MMTTTVPTYDQLIEPVLCVLAKHPDGLKTAQVYEEVADLVGLSKEQRDELLPSRTQPYYQNRIGWSYDRIKRAGLGTSPSRGHWMLTQAGRDFITSRNHRLSDEDIRELTNIERSPVKGEVQVVRSAGERDSETPEELIDRAVSQLHQSVAAELLEWTLKISPLAFELLVLDLLLAMGYGASKEDLTHTGAISDGGIDGVIALDRLGLEKVYIQAKRWAPEHTIGRPDIQSFYGALALRKATKGVFITTSTFSVPARDYVEQVSNRIVLVDGALLTQLMLEYGVGVSTHRVYTVRRVDTDYFEQT